jgi:hypothetical protein
MKWISKIAGALGATGVLTTTLAQGWPEVQIGGLLAAGFMAPIVLITLPWALARGQ